ncbi:hypothetical protein [Pseudomonas yamanorum]
MSEQNAILGYADSYRTMARLAAKEGKPQEVSMWSVVTDLERNMAPILGAALAREAVLQQRLTAADEVNDTATSLIQRMVANFDTEIECHEDVEPNDLEHDQVLADMREFLAGHKPAAQPPGETVQLAAVAVIRERDDELRLEWLLEGGIAGLEPGQILIVADQDVTDDEGGGELYRRQSAPAARVPKSECPNCLGNSMFRCDACIPDFSPGNRNRARRRAESLGLTIPAAPTPYDGFDNGTD